MDSRNTGDYRNIANFSNTRAALQSSRRSSKNWHNLGAASLLAAAIAFSHSGFAQPAASIDREIATLNQQIASKQQQITALRNRPSAEQAELSSAQKTLSEAQAAFKANASAENESKAHNAEFKLKLAEIKYNKAHADVNALVDDVDQLKSQVAAKQREAKEVSKQASVQQIANERQQQQKASDDLAKHRQQEQELVRSKQEAEAQQKEIERLKAALAAKEAATAKEAAAAAKPAAAAPVAAIAKPAEVKTAEVKAPVAAGSGAIRLMTQQEVLQELQELEKRTAGSGSDRGINDAMYLKKPDTKVTNKDKVILRALGKEQYRGQTQVEAGQYQASVGFNQWPIEFTAGERGQTVFIYDNSDPQKPRLLVYNASLEGGK